MNKWRDEVRARSTSAMEAWATTHGLPPNDLRIGTLIRQIADIQDGEVISRDRIKVENRRVVLEAGKQDQSPGEYEYEQSFNSFQSWLNCEISWIRTSISWNASSRKWRGCARTVRRTFAAFHN